MLRFLVVVAGVLLLCDGIAVQCGWVNTRAVSRRRSSRHLMVIFTILAGTGMIVNSLISYGVLAHETWAQWLGGVSFIVGVIVGIAWLISLVRRRTHDEFDSA